MPAWALEESRAEEALHLSGVQAGLRRPTFWWMHVRFALSWGVRAPRTRRTAQVVDTRVAEEIQAFLEQGICKHMEAAAEDTVAPSSARYLINPPLLSQVGAGAAGTARDTLVAPAGASRARMASSHQGEVQEAKATVEAKRGRVLTAAAGAVQGLCWQGAEGINKVTMIVVQVAVGDTGEVAGRGEAAG